MNKEYLLFMIILVLAACGEIVEKDISNDELLLLAPGDSAMVNEDSVSLWWEYLDGARSYEVHLVSPSFNNAQVVYLDSVTNRNLITMALKPGQYQWEVRAFNAGYSTDFFYRTFTLDTAGGIDISAQGVTIISPQPGATVNSSTVSLWWEEVSGADGYQLRLASPSFSNATFTLDSSLTSNRLNLNLNQGNYEWQVRAENNNSLTTYATSTFLIDTLGGVSDLSAETVDIVAPANDYTTSSTAVTLWWEEVLGATSYQVQVASPSFSNPVFLLDNTIDSTRLALEDLAEGSYEWRVRARNVVSSTPYSNRAFTIDPLFGVEDLSTTTVSLLAPGDSLVISNQTLTFWWDEVNGATSYDLIIVTPSFAATDLLVEEFNLTEVKMEVTLDSGTYEWGVRAVNAASESPLSIRKLIIDP
ncbi:hypothetical protein [Marinoscillum sp.]|uniref:hypothetical protein n=1 Tax=Marinoscillum sp. TaxID=2024838 RepID=UPI003BAA4A41